MTRPKKDPWATTPNTKRKRPMVMITLSRAALEELDKRRGQHSRGAFVEILLQVVGWNIDRFNELCDGVAHGERPMTAETKPLSEARYEASLIRITLGVADYGDADVVRAELDRLRAENARQAETIAKLREIADDALDIAEEYAGEERGASIDVLREALKESEG